MIKVTYIICGIAIFFAISIGIYFVSDHYASQMERSLVKEAALRDLNGKSWQVSQLNENVGVVYFGYTYTLQGYYCYKNDLYKFAFLLVA